MKNKNFKMIYWFDKLCNSKAMKKFTTVWLITLLTMGQAFAGNSSFYTSNRSEEKNEISDVQQTKSVKGRVTDASGETIPGVTISVKGTNQGTTTNIDGEYQLINVQENAVLVFSFVGMETEEIPVAGKTIINVVMSESSIALQEVVAIGYGTMKKSDLTGAVSSVSSRDFINMASSSSNSILAAKAPGVTIRKSNAAPGAAPIIRVRGANSLMGSNDPLIVVDGNYGSLPDMYEIESIEILKDASATAIYGSRGANGVILVTTKRGSQKKPTLEFYSDFSINTIGKRYDLMDAYEFAKFNQSVGAYPFTDAEVEKFKNGGGTDWQDAILQSGLSQSYRVIFSGGSKDIRYHITTHYNDNTGTIRNTEASDYGLKAKVDMDLSNRLTVQVEASAGHNDNLNPELSQGGSKTAIPLMAAVAFSPTVPIYDENGRYTPLGVGSGTLMNPVLMTEAHQRNYGNGATGVGNLQFKITDDLTLNAKALISLSNGGTREFESLEYNRLYPRADQYSYDNKNWLTNAFLTYSKTFANNHDFSAMVGFEQTKYEGQSFSASADRLPIESVGWNNLGLAAPYIGVGSGWADNALRSYFGRINYNYASRYYLTVNYRADGSSKFRGDNRWGYFPSFSLAWRLSEEAFMKEQDLFQNIRIRGGYGVTGSQAVGSYATYSPLRGMGFFWGGSAIQSGYISQIGGNPNLKWESTKQLNVGADFTLIDSRLSLSLDYYNKKTVDLLAPLAVPAYAGGDPEYGRTSVISNVGSVRNEGFEFNLNYFILKTKDWSYDINLNGAFNRNKVLDLGEEARIYGAGYAPGLASTSPFVLMPGQPIGTIFGMKYLGIWQENQAEEAAKYGAQPGDYRYEDLNGNNAYDSDDQQVIGNTNAPFSWGFNNHISIKNVDFNILFEGVHGRDIMNWAYLVATERIDFTQLYTHKDSKDRWTPSNPNAKFARIGNSHLIPLSSQYVEDGSYVKLRNLSVGYRIPKSVVSFATLRLSLSAQNLLVFTKYKGYDPEISSTNDDMNSGMDWFAYPNSRSISFGVAIEY
ncbi:TonB-linked outer membrane protein, SusC/RagA family [Porphyromonadaceae bacterium KHP3R9]|nr:TonB-linked outer membrane protein, SusC/RagA family [Porphyromonadaceae bacterium KHP3R9]